MNQKKDILSSKSLNLLFQKQQNIKLIKVFQQYFKNLISKGIIIRKEGSEWNPSLQRIFNKTYKIILSEDNDFEGNHIKDELESKV